MLMMLVMTMLMLGDGSYDANKDDNADASDMMLGDAGW